jgi:hypothetical protein
MTSGIEIISHGGKQDLKRKCVMIAEFQNSVQGPLCSQPNMWSKHVVRDQWQKKHTIVIKKEKHLQNAVFFTLHILFLRYNFDWKVL